MRNASEDAPRRYVIVDSDPHDSDRDGRYLYLNRTLSPDYAANEFPGPLSHARDEDATDHYGHEVRRLLYYGPTRKRSGTPVRILFTILPPGPDDPPEAAESVIFLLRLLYGGQTLAAEEDPT